MTGPNEFSTTSSKLMKNQKLAPMINKAKIRIDSSSINWSED